MSLQSFPQGSRPAKHADSRQQVGSYSHSTPSMSASPGSEAPSYANRIASPYDPVAFAPRPTWESHSSDPLSQRHTSYQHQRPVHHPYASYDARHIAEMDSLHNAYPHPPHTAHTPSSTASPSAPSPGQASSSRLTDVQQRHVSRAACLSCRTAKRKCDGFKPICGPCTLRGVKEGVPHEDGGCVFVASKRGGPRFKGIKGTEATKKKLNERDKNGRIKVTRSSSGAYGTDEAQSVSPSDPGTRHTVISHHPTPASSASDLPSLHGQRPDTISPRTPDTPVNQHHSNGSGDGSGTNGHLDGVGVQQFGAGSFPLDSQRGVTDFYRPAEQVRGGLFDDLPMNNTEMYHKLQDYQTGYGASLASFYQKLEDLPKAGGINSDGPDDFATFDIDMPQAMLDIQTATLSSVAINSEQQSRALLSDYYELVYPACPVMLPSGHLSSLAFHLSEDDSSALLSAISACVALHLPQSEVLRIVKGSSFFHDPNDHETKAELLDLERASRQEIAAYLAKSAEKLLLKKVALLARSFSFPSDHGKAHDSHRYANNVKGSGPDLELVRIKLVATHTLLAHYHYGSCNARRAFHFATQAWNQAQALNLDAEESLTLTPSWFSQEQKCEWARRAYWISYTAATVMSCTGGFKPLVVTRDMPSDLGLLPNLRGDRSSWKVLVRGAQFVSRAYASLYDLDSFKNKPEPKTSDGLLQAQDRHRRWEAISERMQKVDGDVMQYARNDAAWSDGSCFAGNVGLSRRVALFEEENEIRLSRSLRVAGKLMTSGALIILHRAQAFANAKIFVAPTCGIPGACEDLSDTASEHGIRPKRAVDRLWHRDIEARPASGKSSLSGDLIGSVDDNRDSEERDSRSQSGSSYDSSGGGSHSKKVMSPSLSGAPKMAFSTDSAIPSGYNGGPFEPSDSLDRCRFAASVMFAQLEHINASTFQHGRLESMAVLPVEGANTNEAKDRAREHWSAPSLPPFSACSLVLAAYVLLMETLHAQIAAGTSGKAEAMDEDNADDNEDVLPAVLRPDPHRSAPIIQASGQKAAQLAVKLQDCIIEIEAVLDRFSRAWDIAKGYAQEVKLLLEVNQSLFADPAQ